jgi:hypothetical protein
MNVFQSMIDSGPLWIPCVFFLYSLRLGTYVYTLVNWKSYFCSIFSALFNTLLVGDDLFMLTFILFRSVGTCILLGPTSLTIVWTYGYVLDMPWFATCSLFLSYHSRLFFGLGWLYLRSAIFWHDHDLNARACRSKVHNFQISWRTIIVFSLFEWWYKFIIWFIIF